MWCAICKKDVAAEIIGAQDPRCSCCGTTILSGPLSRPRTRTQKARDLLEKWSQPQTVGSSPAVASSSKSIAAEKQVDDPDSNTVPLETTGKEAAHSVEQVKSDAVPEEPATKNLPVYRFDRPHPSKVLPEMEANPKEEQSEDPVSSRVELERSVRGKKPETTPIEKDGSQETSSQSKLQLHSAHLEIPEPHFRIPTETEFPEEASESSVTLLAGYMMSYLGVLGLLTGTVLVVIGYFKGPLNYMPMGWTINAIGQFFLFLGIVTLVTSKMDRMKSNLISELHFVRQSLRPHHSSAADRSESSNDAFEKTDKAA